MILTKRKNSVENLVWDPCEKVIVNSEIFLTNNLQSLMKKIEVSIATILSFTFEFTAGEFVLYIIIMYVHIIQKYVSSTYLLHNLVRTQMVEVHT